VCFCGPGCSSAHCCLLARPCISQRRRMRRPQVRGVGGHSHRDFLWHTFRRPCVPRGKWLPVQGFVCSVAARHWVVRMRPVVPWRARRHACIGTRVTGCTKVQSTSRLSKRTLRRCRQIALWKELSGDEPRHCS